MLFFGKRAPATLALFGLLLLATAAYWPGLSGGFTFDDSVNIHQNTAVQLESLNSQDLLHAAFSKKAGPLFRPVPMLSLGLNYYAAGLNPLPYKVTNLMLHLTTVLAVFFLCREILQSRVISDDRAIGSHRQDVTLLSLIAAGLFACHPYNLTPVLYIVQRMTLLATLFSVLALWVYLVSRRLALQENASTPGTAARLGAATAFAGLAVLSKENALTLLLLAPLVEAVTYRFRRSDGHRSLALTIIAIASVLAFFALVGQTIGWSPESWAANFARRPFSLHERLLTEGRVVATYLAQTIAPRLPEMALYHDDLALSTGFLSPVSTLFSWALIAILCLIALWPQTPVGLRFAIIWFFCAHSLESTVIPLEIMHEHRNYFPSIGLFIGLAMTLSQYSARVPLKTVRTVGILAVMVLASLTHSRSWTWSDPVTHAYTEVAHHPLSYRSNYGAAYAAYGLYLMRGEPKYLNESLALLDRAAQLDPTEVAPLFEKSRILLLAGVCPDPALYAEIERRLASSTLAIVSMNYLQSYAPCMASNTCVLPNYAESLYLAAATNETLTAHYRGIAYDAFSRYVWLATGNAAKARELNAQARALSPNDLIFRLHEIEYLLLGEDLGTAREKMGSLDTMFAKLSTRLTNLQAYRRYLELSAELRDGI